MEDSHKKRVVDASVEALLSSSFKDGYHEDLKENLLSLNHTNFEFIIDQIRKSVNVTVINSLKDRESITLPRLGTFKYKKGKELSYDKMKEICQQYGYNNVRSIPDPTLKAKVKEEVNIACNKVRLDNYFATHQKKGNIVLSKYK